MKHIYKNTLLAFLLILVTFPVFAQHQNAHNVPNKKQNMEENMEENQNCPLIDSILDFAKTKLGCAYRSGGTGPSSFDCSGFTYYVFGQFGIKLGRSSRDQILMGQKVNRDEIRPGDLVFWYRGRGYVGHTGLVVSVDSSHNFTFIHAATYGKGVRYNQSTSNWYASTYAGARRIIDCSEQGTAYLIKADGKSSTIEVTYPKEEVVTTDTQQTQKQEVQDVTNAPATTPTPPAPTPKTTYHLIKNGETLSTIAKKYHVSVKQLKQWNHLKSDMIRAGKKLKIIR